MEVLLMAALMAVSNIVCLVVGAKVGQQTAKGEKVELPTVNPMQAYREKEARKEARKEAQREQDRLDTILRNIENYDGTGRGQEEVK